MKKTVALFIIVALLAAAYVFFQQKTRPPTDVSPATTPTPGLSVVVPTPGVIPGRDNEQGLVAKLGQPIRIETIENTKTYIYRSGVGNKAMNVDVGTNGVVSRIIQPVLPALRLDAATKDMGIADLQLYGTLERSGFRLYVYLNKGVAILGNPTTLDVAEYWYFQPTDAATFQGSVAAGFTSSYDANKQ